MSLQTIYDTVTDHLLTQKCRSLMGPDSRDPGMCAYRGPNGMKCAVGVLIPDSIYDKEMEGCAVATLVERFLAILQLFPTQEEQCFLFTLQGIHDDPNNWNDEGLNEAGIRELNFASDRRGLKPNPKLQEQTNA